LAELLLKKEISKPKIQVERTGSLFFFLTFLLFLVSVASYGGIWFLNGAQKRTQESLFEQVKTKEAELRPELVNQIFLLEKRLSNMRLLLDEHIFVSNVLRRLEDNTHPQVRFLGFNFISNLRRVDTTGAAANYNTVAKQVGILKRDPQIESLEFGGLSMDPNGLVNFRMSITFKPTLLKLN
jgi:hypothetical protein